MTTAPTPSPTPSPSPPATPSAAPSPTVGPVDDRGFPTSVLGLPVHTVAGINELASKGKLDGRLAAVAGYWSQQALPCAYEPHIAVLSGYCAGGTFADTPEAAQSGADREAAPVVVPETAGELNSGPMGSPNQVVLIVHAGDSRARACSPQDRASCQSRLVVDDVAWMNGTPKEIAWYVDAVTKGVNPGEQVVSLFQLAGTDLNQVEPRMMSPRLGLVVFLRLITGTPDADGISDGVERLVSIDRSQVENETPLKVGPDYNPARVVLDARPPEGLDNSQFLYGISMGPDALASGRLDSSTPPLVLDHGVYIAHGSVDSSALVQDPLPCELELTLNSSADVAYYAQFNQPSGCTWKIGEWPFN